MNKLRTGCFKKINTTKTDTTPPDLNGKRHILGYTKFINDEITPDNMLHITILHSKYAHAEIKKLSIEKALKTKGIFDIITAEDIPGENQIGHLLSDEMLLADKKVLYVGQPVALILSENPRDAELALDKIEIEYKELKPILSIDEAIANDSFYISERLIERGDLELAFEQAPHRISGQIESGSQEHFYMETQRCRAIIGENDEIILSSATQSTSEVQEIAARVLNLSSKDITVDVKRLGGAFGGKERNATLFACLTALAAYLSKRPVELVLSRHQDISCTGKRHPFKSDYEICFDDEGKILGYKVDLFSNGGASIDLSIAILERAMFHAENAYFIPNIKIRGNACKTNLPPNTAFRGFGAPQGIFVIENAISKIAHFLNKEIHDIQKINIYKEKQSSPYGQEITDAPGSTFLNNCMHSANYIKLKEQVTEFNKNNRFKKRGLASIPIKFGISFTTAFLNQGSALIWIYSDGSISVSHGGVEMGQSINKKIALIVAETLGISLDKIRIESANTKRIGNASPTAASTGADINGNAVKLATQKLRNRLVNVAFQMQGYESQNTDEDINVNPHSFKCNIPSAIPKISFKNNQISIIHNSEQHTLSFDEVVHQAYLNRVDLGCHAFYKTPDLYFDREVGKGQPFNYYVFGASLVEVEIDLIHGYFNIPKVYIVHETGKSLDRNIDKGQITGAFVQGYGWCTMEEETFDEKGRYLALTPSTYKFPTIRDIPQTWNIGMIESDCKKASIMGSKAIGEPPFIYGLAVWFAIKNAIESINDCKTEANLKHPATPEAILMSVEELKSTERNNNV